MSRPRPLNMRERREAWEAYKRAPKNVWLIGGVAADQSYPCRCPDGRPCDGRPDPDDPGRYWCACHGRRVRQSHRCCGGNLRPSTVDS